MRESFDGWDVTHHSHPCPTGLPLAPVDLHAITRPDADAPLNGYPGGDVVQVVAVVATTHVVAGGIVLWMEVGREGGWVGGREGGRKGLWVGFLEQFL